MLLCGVAAAQISTNFGLTWSTTSGGGGVRQSPNFLVQDVMGQDVAATSASAAFVVEGGFAAGLGGAPVAGDAYEEDDSCGEANPLGVGDPVQSHDFHDVGDRDRLRFSAQANKTYVIELTNSGSHADAIINLHNECNQPPKAQGTNSFGSTVRLEWDSPAAGDYFLEIQQFDPSFAGPDTNYTIKVSLDTTPPAAPTNPPLCARSAARRSVCSGTAAHSVMCAATASTLPACLRAAKMSAARRRLITS